MISRRIQIKDLESQVGTLKEKLEGSEANNQKLIISLETKKSDLSISGAELKRLRVRLSEKNALYDKKEREYTSLQSQYNKLEEENSQNKEKTSELETKVTELGEINTGLESEIKYLKSPANVKDVKAFLGEQEDKDYAEMKQALMEMVAKGRGYTDEEKETLTKYNLSYITISDGNHNAFVNFDFDINNAEEYNNERHNGFFQRRFKDEEGHTLAAVSFNTKDHRNYENNINLIRLASEADDLMKAGLYGMFKQKILSDDKSYAEAVEILDKHGFLVDAAIKDIKRVCDEDVNARGHFSKYFVGK